MLVSQYMLAAVSIFVTPFTIMAVALMVEWFHSSTLNKTLHSNDLNKAEA